MPCVTAVRGTISTANEQARTRLTAVFHYGCVTHYFTCAIVPSIQTFSSENAQITFTNYGALGGSAHFVGHIGKNDLSLDLGNGTKITGRLDAPINSASTTVGAGSWVQDDGSIESDGMADPTTTVRARL